MGAQEFFRSSFKETIQSNAVDKYIEAARLAQLVLDTALEPSSQQVVSEFPGFHPAPQNAQRMLDPTEPSTAAAMLSSAVALSARLYKNPILANSKSPSLQEIWRGTRLESLARKCSDVVRQISPTLSGTFIDVDLTKLTEKFKENMLSGGVEHVIITGPNGVGKTTAVNVLRDVVKVSKIRAEVIKFPRSDGVLAKMLAKILKGKERFDPNGLQTLFYSDALDFKPTPNVLMIYDRHPKTDGLVYGPKGDLETVLLAASQLLKGNYWAFVLNRHPLATLKSVEQRNTDPRIFEKNVDQMIEQMIRFAGLTKIPGTFWINNDIPEDLSDPNLHIEISVRRFFGSVMSSGVLQRQMIKQGSVSNFENATQILISSFFEVLYRRLNISINPWR